MLLFLTFFLACPGKKPLEEAVQESETQETVEIVEAEALQTTTNTTTPAQEDNSESA